ncbi:MAG: serine/threonine-protein kinase [Gemmatimonadaceae bacterium]|nr:serine/threonine-protein kinase [Gemmatimonadaceae bacterium]
MTTPADRLAAALAGRYRLERELGQGGMATVYLAFDEKHDRKVAIKVLKPELAAVLGAERFVVEIKTTAAMSHPHILPLLDSGEADGFLYYVMPYIEGETIREKLTRETQFGIEEAVRITREIADALDYAHRRGIIHRDVKPENILLHDGRAMVMDFGIALAVSAAAGGRMTETGLSLGTPHYMSPEQATAEKEITPRSDVYSLASVLYEMLAGQPPHLGGSAQAIIMKIIAEPAQLVTQLRKSVPTNVAAALDMALQKVPADRFESAAKFAEALANPAFTTRGTAQLTSTSGHTRGIVTPWFVAMTAVALVTSALAVWGWRRSGPAGTALQSVQFAIDLPDSVTVEDVAVSPDGQQVVIGARANGRRTLLSRRIDDVEVRELPGTSGGARPFFSPDGEWIAFFAPEGKELRKIPSTGGASQKIASLGARSAQSSGTWSPNGTIVVSLGAAGGGGLSRVDANGGLLQRLTTVDTARGDRAHFLPTFLDGETIAYRIGTKIAGAYDFATTTLDGKATRRQLPGLTLAPWSRDTVVVFNEEHGLSFTTVAQDDTSVGTLGPSLADDVLNNQGTFPIWALSATRTLVYLRGRTDRQLVAVTRSGEAQPLMPAVRPFRRPKPSPDGQRIVVELLGATALDTELWMFDRRASTLQRLTFGGGKDAVWTADGARVVYSRTDSLGDLDLYWQLADGSGSAERLLARPGPQNALAATPDGSGIIFDDRPQGGTTDILLLPLAGDRTPRPILATEFTERLPAMSPDGQWMTYTSNESGRVEVYVRPFPGPGAKVQISVAGGEQPTWSPSGREIFYRDDTKMLAAAVQLAPTFAVTARTPLFTDSFLRSGTLDYDVLPAGGFVMLQPSAASQLMVITNWQSSTTKPRAK